jgi:hypothetical protein
LHVFTWLWKAPGVRWESLFDDLSAQLLAEEQAELAAEVAERSAYEAGRVALAERLQGAIGEQVAIRVEGVGALRGRLAAAGPDWLLIDAGHPAPTLVAAHALLSVGTRRSPPAQPLAAAESRLDLRRLVRRLVVDQPEATVVLRDGSTQAGSLHRVGADHLQLLDGQAQVLVPLTAVALIKGR